MLRSPAGIASILVMLAGTHLEAQEAPSDLAGRLRLLEEKAARAEMLEAKVTSLEEQLKGLQGTSADAELAAAVNALIGKEGGPTVAARKASMITLGGQLRLRSEYRTVSLYGVPRPRKSDEDVTIQRTRVNLDARLLDDVRVFVEIQDSRSWGEEQAVLGDLEGVDLHQGFVDFERVLGSDFTLRAGRFELSLWNQRLISPLDWSAVSRAWDGLLLFGKVGDFELTAGYDLLAEDPLVDSDKDTDFTWLAATYRGIEDHEIGAALFWLHSNAGTVDLSFGTATLHAQGRIGGFDYSGDGVLQFGGNEERTVHAYATALTSGWTFEADWKPRIGIEWTYATGDSDPADGRFQTFNPLFPFSHFYQGYLDFFAWQNGHDLAIHAEARPDPDWWVEAAFHAFWLDTPRDAWFGASGAPIRPAPAAAGARYALGKELDISAKYWLSKDAWFWFGYSHFFAGDFVEDTGQSPDSDWLWLQFTATF